MDKKKSERTTLNLLPETSHTLRAVATIKNTDIGTTVDNCVAAYLETLSAHERKLIKDIVKARTTASPEQEH